MPEKLSSANVLNPRNQAMKVVDCQQVESAAVETEGSQGCTMRCLIGEADGAPSFTMRQFEVAPGGYTPQHKHAHEHEVFVLEGSGVVMIEGTERTLRPGTAVFVPPQHLHQFRNTASTTLKFLCLIPHPLRAMAGTCVAACGCE
jgi:quercetin dioxygenase-like cupin family protein